MTDQAATLRVLRGGKSTIVHPRRAIAVTGGKGGVGKSTVSVNLAIAHAQAGAKVLLVDTDLGMADLNLLLGIAPEHSILDALGGMPLRDILVEAHGIHVLPALNGSYLMSTLGPAGLRRVLDMVQELASEFDTAIVDVAAGIGLAQTTFAGAVSDALVVVNPEPLSMADAYACLKVLSVEQGVRHAYVVPNRTVSRAQADEVAARLGALVARFLDLDLTTLPSIPADMCVSEAAQIGVPLVIHAPDSPAARAVKNLTRTLSVFAPTTDGWLRTNAQGVSR